MLSRFVSSSYKTRKDEVMTLFQELLLISLGKRECFSRSLTDSDWSSLYTEAHRQSLVGVMLTGVERAVAAGENKPEFLLRWIAQGMAVEQQNRRLNVRCREVTDIFKGLGLRSCVLKGQGVALLYPHPLRRQCGDIDLWVEGRRDDTYKTLKERWRVCETVIHHADVEIFKDTPTEIHFIPSFTYSPFLYRRYKRFFKRYGGQQFANFNAQVGFAYPTVAFNAVHSLMHIFHHVLHEGIGLRQLLDYYYILRNLTEEQRCWAYTEMRQLGLARFAAAVMYVERQIFELESAYLLCEPDEHSGRLLLSEIERAGNFGQFDERNLKVDRRNVLKVYGHNVRRNFVFFRFSPSEVLWAPLWKPCHFVWRKMKGYS